MGNLWGDIKKTIREGVDTVVEKTEEQTKIGRIKVDILNIKRNVEKNFTELGGKVYHMIVDEKKTQISNNKEVKEIVDCIRLLEKELDQKNVELEQVKAKESKNGARDTAAQKTTTRSSKTRTSKTTARKKAPAKKSTASKARSTTKPKSQK